MKTPDLRQHTIWSYKGKEYRVLSLSPELIQDEEGNWVQTVKYRTVKWTPHVFNRAYTDFIRKFELVSEPEKKAIKLNALELQVLMGMNDNFSFSEWSEGGYYYPFKTIQRYSGIPMEKVRRTVRSLARKGLMEYCRGLMTEDQEAGGSGYRITKEGREYVEELTKTRQLSSPDGGS